MRSFGRTDERTGGPDTDRHEVGLRRRRLYRRHRRHRCGRSHHDRSV